MRRFAPMLAFAVLVLAASGLHASPIISLGAASEYAVLGGASVTSAGISTISGSVGAGAGVTGFPPGSVSGTIDVADPAEAQAEAAASLAFQALSALTPTTNLTGMDLGGMLLTPGVYVYSTSAQLTGTLTLNFEGLNNQILVIQTGTTLTTASGSSVVVTNAGTGDQVYFEVGSSATLGTGTALVGDVLAAQSITLDTGVSITGGDALAVNGSVTLDGSTVSLPAPVVVLPADPVATTPEPSGVLLLGSGMVGMLAMFGRRPVVESAAA